MISDEDKILAYKAIKICHLFNLNNQIRCNDIFGCLNRIWNRATFDQAEDQSNSFNSDTAKFRKLLLHLFKETDAERLLNFSGLSELVNVRPYIHDDDISRAHIGRPFDPRRTQRLSEEQTLEATIAHKEFISQFDKLSSNQTNKNKKRFLEKLARLLFTIRSNIAHGSKTHYEGSHRNEEICSHTYKFLQHVINEILDNGLFRVAAYGELKRGGQLFKPLVKQNEGSYIGNAKIMGGLIETSNSIMFDEYSERLEEIDLEILEFKSAQAIHNIDVVETMPRSLYEIRDSNNNLKFAWIYTRTASITDRRGSISTPSRQAEIEEKVRTFLLSLVAIQRKYSKFVDEVDGKTQSIYPRLTIQKGFKINYEGDFWNGSFTHPLASNFISFIDEVEVSYRSLFGGNREAPPFIGKIRSAIWEDLLMNKRFYEEYVEDDLMEVSLDNYKLLISHFPTFIAHWACYFCGDEDAILWDQLSRETSMN